MTDWNREWTMRPKKKLAQPPRTGRRQKPLGIQQMGPRLYQKLKAALRELTPKPAATAQ